MKNLRQKIVAMAAVVAVSGLMMASVAGAADKLIVRDAGNTADVFKVDDAGTVIGAKLGMGTTTPQSKIHLNWPSALGALPAVGTALYSNSTGFVATTQDNTFAADFTVADGTATAGYRGTIRGVRARGALATPSQPSLDDYVFSVLGGVYTGYTNPSTGVGEVWNAADISMKVDGTVAHNTGGASIASPVRITFSTRPGGWTWYERMTIKSDGKVGISAPTPTALLDVNADVVRFRTAKTPLSATDTCNQGDHAWDSGFVYVCVAANSWKRAALSAW